MKLLSSVLLLASLAILAQAKPSAVQAPLQATLDKYLNARNFDVDSPDVTANCFSLYLPMLNEVAAAFSSSYQACISAANAVTANLTAEALKEQSMYKQEVSSLCGAFSACDSSDNDTFSFFTCYASAAQADISVIYDISTNAATTGNTLAEALKANQDTEYQCTNTTESNYVRDTAATYDLLDACLKNGLPTASTAAPTTVAVTPTGTQSSQSGDASVSTITDGAASSVSTAAPLVIASTVAGNI